ncbi:TPA: recombinase family protein [Salmonella enterica]|nr:recombinase family protein [Salmonella enterica]
MKKLYSYIRWSTDKQTGNSSLERQTEKAKQYAAIHGLEYVQILDAGVSAFRGKNTTHGELSGFINGNIKVQAQRLSGLMQQGQILRQESRIHSTLKLQIKN